VWRGPLGFGGSDRWRGGKGGGGEGDGNWEEAPSLRLLEPQTRASSFIGPPDLLAECQTWLESISETGFPARLLMEMGH
jgi:hypothetical protein